jgi:mRNA interferase MazF
MKRGDIVTIAVAGDFGKPRPALIVQADRFIGHTSITVLPMTSDLHDAPELRITVQPTPRNGLRHPSQIMVDRAMTAPRGKIGRRIGRLDRDTLVAVNRSLAMFLGIG